MQRILSFQQTPSLSVPLRFFLSIPLFAIAAGVLLLWHGPQALVSRWSPLTLALTHLLTLGVLAMAMIGALFQILPVMAGVNIPRPALSAGLVHLLLSLGAASLAAAFYLTDPLLFKLALPLLLGAFGWLLGACGIGLWHSEGASATLVAIRLALCALGVAVLLGATAASAFAWPLSLPLIELTNLHAGWALLGWVGLLVAGVAYQVVPMFQVTPSYPQMLTRWLAWTLFALLALWTMLRALAPQHWTPDAVATMLGAGYAVFAAVTLRLLVQRKRPKPEPSTYFWYVGAASLLACVALWLAGEAVPELTLAPAYPLALGILFIVGFGYSIVNGMLYKIVPFLVWYHLQEALAEAGLRAPNVKQVIADHPAQGQFYAHAVAFVLLTGASFWPQWLARPAAAAFILSSCWLGVNLLRAMRVYRDALRQLIDRGEVAAAT